MGKQNGVEQECSIQEKDLTQDWRDKTSILGLSYLIYLDKQSSYVAIVAAKPTQASS